MEVVYSVSDIDVSTLPSLPSNPTRYIAREFNSKACKAIWDLDGILITSMRYSHHTDTFQVSTRPLATFLASASLESPTQASSAQRLQQNYSPPGTSAKAN